MTKPFTLQKLADYLEADFQGDPRVKIYRLNTLQDAGTGDLAFLSSRTYARFLSSTEASVVILNDEDAKHFSGNIILHSNPYLAYATVSALFDVTSAGSIGVHPSATVHDRAVIAKTASVGPGAVVEEGADIGEGAIIGAGCFIGSDSSIGANSRLDPNVTVYHGVFIGCNVLIHSGAVIGSDGFGFANNRGQWQKIHQLGGVEIGDRVEIGACTTIDRGALGNTQIGNGVIIDNLVQIAHNVKIGDNSALAGCTAIAGSTIVGKNCVLAGGAGLVGHIKLCDGVTVSARSMITKSIAKPGTYSSGTPFFENVAWKKNAVRFGQIDQLARRVSVLEKSKK